LSARILTAHPLVEEILDAWRVALGRDRDGYRGHVYRTLNFCRALAPDGTEDRTAAACAFHDLGVWPAGTLDYLPDSVERATDWLERSGRGAWRSEVTLAIEWHHKLTRYRGAHAATVEALRRADVIDGTWGLLGAGLPRPFLRDVFTAFPDAGFRPRIARLILRWVVRHPTRPLPVVRW
jgi:hypothetical protein